MQERAEQLLHARQTTLFQLTHSRILEWRREWRALTRHQVTSLTLIRSLLPCPLGFNDKGQFTLIGHIPEGGGHFCGRLPD